MCWADQQVGMCHAGLQDGRTPLFIACQHNRVEVVSKLLQAGADVSKPRKVHTNGTCVVCLKCC